MNVVLAAERWPCEVRRPRAFLSLGKGVFEEFAVKAQRAGRCSSRMLQECEASSVRVEHRLRLRGKARVKVRFERVGCPVGECQESGTVRCCSVDVVVSMPSPDSCEQDLGLRIRWAVRFLYAHR